MIDRLEEAIELHQQDENTSFVEKALQTTGGHKVPGNPANPDTKSKKETQDKEKKETKTKKDQPDKKAEKAQKDKDKKGSKIGTEKATVTAAPGTSKGGGKGGKKGDGSGTKTEAPKNASKEDRSKQPCMYFAFNSCTKGDKCPYLHDKNKLYKGEKPRGLEKTTPAGSATVHAGAAKVLAGAVASSSVVGSTGVCSHSAPLHEASPREANTPVEATFKGIWNRTGGGHGWNKWFCKGLSQQGPVQKHVKNTSKRVMSQKNVGHRNTMLFEKAFKCFAAMATVCAPMNVTQDFLIDSGAGRNLISQKDLPDQWIQHLGEAPEKLKFATGGGVRNSTQAINLRGELSGDGVFYALKDCPPAISLGQQVNDHGRAWVWFPGELPYFIKSDRLGDVVHHCPESAKIYADRVVENVPVLCDSIECIAMPATDSNFMKEHVSAQPSKLPEPGVSSSSGVKPSAAPPASDPGVKPPVAPPAEGSGVELGVSDKALADEVVPVCPPRSPVESVADESDQGGPLVDVHSSEDDGEEAAKTLNHSLTHYPKSRHCEICKRAKMTSRYHRRRGDPDEDETPPLHFGHQMRVDHIIIGSDLSKGSEGEQACLICFDEYSGCYQAFAQSSRTTSNNVACLRKFGGTRAHGRALCSVKSDSAQELTEAVKQLGWLPEPGLPNDPYHNAKLESNIRRIKEGTRAIHLAAGFPHELWPRSIEYFCVAKSFTTLAPIHPNEPDEVKRAKQGLTCYEVANGGEPFEGHRVPLGALVYYKPPQHLNRPAFEARTLPGIFVGWRIDAGFKHRKVHLVLDYESVRTNAKGFGRPIQVHATELVVPEKHIFPLFQAEQSKIEGVQVFCQ